MEGNIWDQGVLFVILPFALFMDCVRSLVYMWFVFLVSISVLPGIFCDKLGDAFIN